MWQSPSKNLVNWSIALKISSMSKYQLSLTRETRSKAMLYWADTLITLGKASIRHEPIVTNNTENLIK